MWGDGNGVVLLVEHWRPVVVMGLGACCWGSGVSHCVWWPGAVMRHLSVVDGGVLIRVVVENCIVDASILIFCVLCVVQVVKCDRWMPWHQEPMKDVVTCDKPWGVGKRAVIRGCPNGETWNVRSSVR